MLFSFKKVNIESPTPTTQAGHLCQTYFLDEYHDHLFARLSGFKDENNWIIHVSLDLLSFSAEKKADLVSKVHAFYQNKNIQIITSSTHTHYANKPDDEKYYPWLIQTLVTGITSMEYKEYEDVKTSYQYVPCQVVGKSRISGYESNNEYLSLLAFYSKGVNFFNFIIHNCHPTILKGDTKFFSAEFPGYVLKKLEDHYAACFTYASGAQGDISSRFVRDGQTYESVEKLGNNLFIEVEKLLKNSQNNLKPLTLAYKSIRFPYDHNFEPVDLSKIRSDLSERELETIKLGQIMRERLNTKAQEQGVEKAFIMEIEIGKLSFGSISFVFFPNEIFSAYLSELNLNERILVSYSNGYGPYVLPIGFEYVTYEMFTDTLSVDCKRRLIETFKTI